MDRQNNYRDRHKINTLIRTIIPRNYYERTIHSYEETIYRYYEINNQRVRPSQQAINQEIQRGIPLDQRILVNYFSVTPNSHLLSHDS